MGSSSMDKRLDFGLKTIAGELLHFELVDKQYHYAKVHYEATSFPHILAHKN